MLRRAKWYSLCERSLNRLTSENRGGNNSSVLLHSSRSRARQLDMAGVDRVPLSAPRVLGKLGAITPKRLLFRNGTLAPASKLLANTVRRSVPLLGWVGLIAFATPCGANLIYEFGQRGPDRSPRTVSLTDRRESDDKLPRKQISLAWAVLDDWSGIDRSRWSLAEPPAGARGANHWLPRHHGYSQDVQRQLDHREPAHEFLPAAVRRNSVTSSQAGPDDGRASRTAAFRFTVDDDAHLWARRILAEILAEQAASRKPPPREARGR